MQFSDARGSEAVLTADYADKAEFPSAKSSTAVLKPSLQSARGLAHSRTLSEFGVRPNPRKHPGVRRPSAPFESTD